MAQPSVQVTAFSSRGRPLDTCPPAVYRASFRSSSSETAAKLKRKGGRSVSTLTPQQLARKRANDREAQRAIRARTKDHIERLERELDELRNLHDRDQTIQRLMKENRALEDELRQLKESFGIPTAPSYSSPTSPITATPRSSPPFTQDEYHNTVLPDYPAPYVNVSESSTSAESPWTPSHEPQWSSAASVPTSQQLPHMAPASLPPSPLSSHADKYPPTYLSNSLPNISLMSNNSPMHCRPLVSTSAADVNVKVEPMSLPQAYLHQQPWELYPIYYPHAVVH